MGLLEDPPDVLLERGTITRRRNPIPLLLGLTGLLVLAVTQWPLGTNSAVAPSLATTTTVPSTTSSGSPLADAGGEAPFSFPEISLVSSSVTGNHAVVVPFSTAGEVQELGAIAHFEVDSSRTYMAALLGTGHAGAPGPLVVGRIGGELNRRITESASGFAWHDTKPGALAYIDAGQSDQRLLRVVDAARAGAVATEGLPVVGWLRHFGSWGFATSQSSLSPGFQLRDSNGAAVFASEVGTAVGYVSTIGMIATLSPGEHVGILPATGEVTQLSTFAGQEFLWHVSAGGPRGMFAVQATSVGFTDHRVLVFNRLNEVVARLPSAPLPQAMTWDRAATKLVYAVNDSTDRTTVVVYDAETSTTTESSFLEDPLHPRTIGIVVD